MNAKKIFLVHTWERKKEKILSAEIRKENIFCNLNFDKEMRKYGRKTLSLGTADGDQQDWKKKSNIKTAM